MTRIPILEHLEKLKDRAVQANKQRHDDIELFEKYYRGKQNGKRAKLNVIKGIVDTKTAFVLDNEIVSSVLPRSKSFSDIAQLDQYESIAGVLNDCNKNILKQNNYDSFKKKIIKNANVTGYGIGETTWEQNSEKELGDVKIKSLKPSQVFFDTSAEDVKDMNYFVVKEIYSSITLKKKYPQFIEEIDKAAKSKNEQPDKKTKTDSKNYITGKLDTGDNTQMYTNSENPLGSSIAQSQNIVVWKCYIKDESTFLDKIDEPESVELAFKYPNGRLFRWVDGAEDYLLEDKTVDYPFGFPVDVLKYDSVVEDLIEVQDRIDRAFLKIQGLVGAYVSFIAHGIESGLTQEEIVNDFLIECDNPQALKVITNNTLEQLNAMIAYVKFLKEQAYEISRVNPAMISGKKEEGIKSGKMLEALNESPLTAIRDMQKEFKNFIVSQGNKNIVLIQLYYKVARMIRISGDQYALISPKIEVEGQSPIPPSIEIFKRKTKEEQFESIKTINSDLSIGEYDIDVIAGTEMPRSRDEKGRLIAQFYDNEIIPHTKQGINILLDALDVPDKAAIIDAQNQAREEQKAAQQQDAGKINMPLELIGKIFKDMPPCYQTQVLAQFNFQIATEDKEITQWQNQTTQLPQPPVLTAVEQAQQIA